MRSLFILKPYFLRYKKTIAIGLTSIFLSTGFGVIVPVIVRDAIDGLRSSVSGTSILQYAAELILLSLLSGLFLYITRQTIIVVSRRIERDMSTDFITHIHGLSLRYFQNTSTGDIMAHATNDIGAVRMFVGPAIMYSTETVLTFIIILAMMISIHPLLTLLSLLPLPLISYIVSRIGKSIHKQFEDIQGYYSKLTTRAQESIAGIRVVKAYLREAYEASLFHFMSEEYRSKNMKMVRIQAFMMPALVFLIGTSLIVVIWKGGAEVINHKLTVGQLTQFIIYLGMLIWPMIAIGWVVNIIQRAAASMERLQTVLRLVPEIGPTPYTNAAITGLRGEIQFENVSFRYGDTLQPVFEHISFHVPAGSTLAIIGLTGSGKSSLVNLLPRLYDASEGRVRIDGHDVRAIPVEVLRRNISYVTQETFLFSDSLQNNIAFSNEHANLEEVRNAAAIAQIDDEILDFPDQYETVLGERGITLSGGQKQRVSLARAVLRDPAILILDDALSAVDTNTEEKILQQLRGVTASRTCILISHRISTVKNADQIIVLHEGAILEQGTHDTLVERDGLYAQLYRKQLLSDELEAMS
jgi:ATP-binding cassette, subfamily B, multidrug efflux pump